MTPAQHYAEADRLLADVTGADLSVGIVRAKIAKAQVHATLATVDPYALDRDEYDEGTAIDCMVARSRVTTVQPTNDVL